MLLVVVPVAAAGLAVASAGAITVGTLAACVAAVADCLVHSSYCSILHPCVSTCVDVWVWCGPVLCPCGVWVGGVVVRERACTLWLWVFAALVSGRLVACGLALGCLRPRGMFLAVRVSARGLGGGVRIALWARGGCLRVLWQAVGCVPRARVFT